MLFIVLMEEISAGVFLLCSGDGPLPGLEIRIKMAVATGKYTRITLFVWMFLLLGFVVNPKFKNSRWRSLRR